jgi:ketosteroid isomerase-like protein
MQKSFRVILALALIGLGAWLWWTFFPGAERAIRAQVAALAQTLSFKPSDGDLPKGIKAMKLLDFFTADVVIQLKPKGFEPLDLDGREAIRESEPLLYFKGPRGLEVEFLDVKLTLGPDRQTAIAHLTCQTTIAGEADYYVQELQLMFKTVDGAWLIYRVETVPTFN